MNLDNFSDRSPDNFLKLVEKERRGRLKIYLGFAAGVGKTYRMLSEGHLLAKRNIDVVIGYLEPHDREETIKKSEGLEIVPPKIIEYRGLALRELDTEAVIRRRPKVALVDEIAHTNAPGSKNEKRYQDVEELLEAGIHVITTMNIQHLESLYDLIEGTTGVKVKERIPDAIVENADFIVNADIEADELIERLKAGKIYKTGEITAALNNFFTTKNLTSLREIVLSETANILEKRQREQAPEQKEMPEKVLVGLSSGGPHPDMLLRKAARIAGHINAQWYAIHVLSDKKDLLPGAPLAKSLELARMMGANVVTLEEKDASSALIKFAKENNITHLVIGRPGKRSVTKLFQRPLLECILRELPDADITIV